MNRSSHFPPPKAWALVALVASLTLTPAAQAQYGGRQPSPAQRAAMQKAMQKQQQQMQAYQKDVARYQQEMADKSAEVAKQFDENGDGRLLGAEKSKYNHHMFEIRNGRKPNPFAGIKPPGQGPATPATK